MALASGVVAGKKAYIVPEEGALQILDIADPSVPTEVGFYDTPGSARSVAVEESCIYVADEYGGLVILRMTPQFTHWLHLPLVVGDY